MCAEYRENDRPGLARATSHLSPMSIDSLANATTRGRDMSQSGSHLLKGDCRPSDWHASDSQDPSTLESQSSQSGSNSLRGDCRPSDWQASDRQDPSTLKSCEQIWFGT